MSEKKEESKTPLIDIMQEEMVGDFVHSILPKITPMLNPLSERLDSYLGNDEKIILIRRNSDKSSATVLVLDTTKDYTIKGGKEKKFTMDVVVGEDGKKKALPLLHYFDTKQFVTELLSGKFTKEEK